MKPRGLSLITKGILAIEKSISLATKGVLDYWVRGGQAQIKTEEWTFKVIGTKIFEQLYNYHLLGRIENIEESIFTLSGRRLLDFQTDYNIKAVLQSTLNYDSLIWGRRQFLLFSDLQIAGIKENRFNKNFEILALKENILNDKLLIYGTKQYDKEFSSECNGIKEINSELILNTIGTKELQIASSLNIKGKRDIKKLLFALDLLGEE